MTEEKIQKKFDEIQEIVTSGGYNRTRFREEHPRLAMWLYQRHRWKDISFPGPELCRPASRQSANHKWHDISKVMHYLARWASEEGTSVAEQAGKYGYGPEYNEWVLSQGK